MAHARDELLANDIEGYLAAHEAKSMLRFLTCGSVDDGKSTLIGRLLYDSKLLFEDHLATLEADSKRIGTQGGELDFALLVDGLAAEREQGITIDVAYRYFSTERRKFIVADTPGHEQYTRNMVTGASTADAAVLLVDARHGLAVQTRRHTYLVALLGIKHLVLAVNKMDLVGHSARLFRAIEAEYQEFASQLGLGEITAIPISALQGDNVVERSTTMPWYPGPSLLEHLEGIELDADLAAQPFRLPVQWVCRPDLDFRGFAGEIVGGSVGPGDPVVVLPSGQRSTISRVVTADGDLDQAVAGQSVTLCLADEVDVSRGDVVVDARQPASVADQFEAQVVWMAEEPMLPGRAYFLKLGTRTSVVTLGHPKYRVDVNTLEHQPARTLSLNEIGVCNLNLDRPIAFDPYAESRAMGGGILIDRLTNATVGAVLLNFALRRSQNLPWQVTSVDKSSRATLNHQRPTLLWFTGISGAGKSTIANLVEARLRAMGRHTYLLDGDNVRHGLSKDLGFNEADRVEHIRRVAEVSRLMVDAGLIVLACFISPFTAERRFARELLDDGEFIEIHLDTTVEVAASRDPKGLYAKAFRGELKNFTGVDSPYERPEEPELRLDTSGAISAEACAEQIIEFLRTTGRFDPPQP